jgi:hypothetical protein
LLDGKYSDFVTWGAPNYPGGKAYDASNPDSIDGTPYKANWMNDINGTRQAIIKYAEGTFNVSGEPDSADKSDVLNALLKIIENVFGRVPTVTRGPCVVDINYARRYQLFFIGNIAEKAKIFLPDISALGGVDVIEIEIFNVSSLYLKVIVYPESELLNIPPGGWVRIRPFPTSDTSSVWGHSYHYKENITPNAPVKYDTGGRLQAARPVLDDHVLRLGDRDIYVQNIDFTDIYQRINDINARIEALEKGAANNILRNAFFITFPNLDGIEMTSGTWNSAKGTLECTYAGGSINIIFTNMKLVELISGLWNRGEGTVEC